MAPPSSHAVERLLIRRGLVVNPAAHTEEVADILIEGGVIRQVGRVSAPPKGAETEVIDASGLVVSPGLVDMHVHLREPGNEEKETIASGSAAAVAGGVTTVAVMPNTSPPVDNVASAEFVILQGARAGKANILPIATVTKNRAGEELAEIGRLAQAGAVAFSDDGAPVQNAEVMRRALTYAKMFKKPVINHCEDLTLAGEGVMHEGFVSTKLGLAGIPAAAEEIMVERDIALAEATGGHIHIAHVSTARAIDAIRRGKARGVRVTAEVTPHHLTLIDEQASDYNANFKMNPPLRTRLDVEAAAAGLADGTIDAIASDHAPHSHDEKEMEFSRAPFGVIGMETTLAVVWTALGKTRRATWKQLLAHLSTAPARILGLSGKGFIAPGADADMTLIDPRKEWTVDPARFFSKSRNWPYAGQRLTAKAVITIVGGQIKYREI